MQAPTNPFTAQRVQLVFKAGGRCEALRVREVQLNFRNGKITARRNPPARTIVKSPKLDHAGQPTNIVQHLQVIGLPPALDEMTKRRLSDSARQNTSKRRRGEQSSSNTQPSVLGKKPRRTQDGADGQIATSTATLTQAEGTINLLKLAKAPKRQFWPSPRGVDELAAYVPAQ